MNDGSRARFWLGVWWKFTGRTPPEGATLGTVVVHKAWEDLLWHDPKRDVWIYLSTRPNG